MRAWWRLCVGNGYDRFLRRFKAAYAENRSIESYLNMGIPGRTLWIRKQTRAAGLPAVVRPTARDTEYDRTNEIRLTFDEYLNSDDE